MTAASGDTTAGGGGGAAATGPPSPDPQRYQVYPFFSGTDGACTNAIYLLPPQYPSPTSRQPWKLPAIPLVYIGPSDLPPPIANDDFTLSFGGPGKAPYSQANATVQVAITTNGNAWKCAATARQTLMGNFTQFLVAVEASGAVTAVGISLIAAQIADSMPAPLPETLFWRYRLSSGLYPQTIPYVDVRPGMRLRVDGEISQFVNPGAAQNSYVPAGRLTFPVGSTGAPDGTRLVSFDALLASIKAPSISPPSQSQAASGASPAGTAVAAGALDLEANPLPYWRLIYPASLPSPHDAGDLGVGHNVLLLGAPTLAELEKATAAYPKSLDTSGTPPNVYLTFLGRAYVVPEVPIFLSLGNAAPQLEWVAVGTTLMNLVERFRAVTADPSQWGTGSSLISAFTRPTSAGRKSVSPTLTGAKSTAVPPAMFDVPLIAGDSISLNL